MEEFKNKEFLEHEILTFHKSHEIISKELNCNINTLKYWIKKFQIKSLKDWEHLNINFKTDIISRYNNEETLRDISTSYNVTEYVIKKVLIANGINIRTLEEVKYIRDRKFQYETNINNVNGRVFSLNHNYFKTWCSDMAYILGFIYADGNVFRTQLSIGLSKIDTNLLTEIKEKLQYEGDLKFREATKSVRLTIRSCVMTDDLKHLGVIENKSLKTKIPNIPQQYFKDFVRGYFDGDGSVGIHMKNQIRTRFFSGSKEFLIELSQKLYDEIGIQIPTISKDKRSECHEICYSTKNSKLIFDYLYSDPNCMKLDRKYEKFIEGISLNYK